MTVRRLLVLSVVLAAFGLFAGSASAGVATSSAGVASSSAAGAECGPCPTVVFALGKGTGRIEAWTVWKTQPPTAESCPVAAVRHCLLYIDEGFDSDAAYLRAHPDPGVTFLGWVSPDGSCTQVGNDCRFTPGVPVNACAKFAAPGESVSNICPPPSLQLYKKGDGQGTVTTTGSSSSQKVCGPICPSVVQTEWAAGDTLTLTAAPAAGSTFVRWDGCQSPQPDGTCRIVLNSSAVVCSVFVKVGSSAPADSTCPYTTPTTVKPPAPPAAVPPSAGSKCTIPGSPYGETLNGSARNDVLCGRGGNDRLNGRGGHDLLLGGAGKDKLYGHAGNDRLRGEGGNDVLYGAAGTDILDGGAGNDVIYSRGDRARDKVSCGRGRDTVYAERRDQVARDCEVVRRA